MSPSQWEGKAVIGGSEHDTWEMNGQIWKVTRPDRFGWTALPGEDGVPEIAEATPLDFAPFGLRGTCPRFPTGRHVGQWESSDMSEQSTPTTICDFTAFLSRCLTRKEK